MLLPGYIGPKERWQFEVEKVNKHGLLALIDSLVFHLECFCGLDRESLLKVIRDCKKHGRWDAAHLRYMRLTENPGKYLDEVERRRKSAKKAARRRKREAR